MAQSDFSLQKSLSVWAFLYSIFIQSLKKEEEGEEEEEEEGGEEEEEEEEKQLGGKLVCGAAL